MVVTSVLNKLRLHKPWPTVWTVTCMHENITGVSTPRTRGPLLPRQKTKDHEVESEAGHSIALGSFLES